MAESERVEGGWAWGGLAGLTLVAAGILGYHPYSEDGGIYLAEIKKAINPGLYPHGGEFVAGHLRVAGFADGVAGVVRGTGAGVEAVMAGVHLLCILGLLVGVWRLAVRCYASDAGRWGAVGAVGFCLTMPVAGTSLLLMDPYATARSVSLALTMLGMAGVGEFLVDSSARWGLGWGFGALGVAGLVHPLMAGYGLGAVVVLRCVMDRRRAVKILGVLGAGVAAVGVAWAAQATAAVETAEYARVAATRYYWFLGEWRWYELVGLAAPVGILGWVGWGRAGSRLEQGLARMGVCVGGIAVAVAGVFAREGGRIHAVARMQPLRCFQVVYVVMLMALGAMLGERVLRGPVWRWGVAAILLGGVMVGVQRRTYPASGYWELPGMKVENRWERAFLWVRDNTAKDALFALDGDYVHRAGEDTQGFRAVAERSVLPDYSKDGGQAAIRPGLTEAWVLGQKAQAGLTQETDGERVRRLAGLGVGWIVIGREGVTRFVCPYENEAVKVCRVP